MLRAGTYRRHTENHRRAGNTSCLDWPHESNGVSTDDDPQDAEAHRRRPGRRRRCDHRNVRPSARHRRRRPRSAKPFATTRVVRLPRQAVPSTRRSRADGVLPDGVTVFDDGYPGVANLDPDLLHVLREAATDAADDGIEFYVNSGWRSPEYQNQLLRRGGLRVRVRRGSGPMGRHGGHVRSRVRERGRHRLLRCRGVAVRTWRRVRAVPDLRQRVLALRTAPRGDRSWLPSHVCRPHARSEDAAVTGSGLVRPLTDGRYWT